MCATLLSLTEWKLAGACKLPKQCLGINFKVARLSPVIGVSKPLRFFKIQPVSVTGLVYLSDILLHILNSFTSGALPANLYHTNKICIFDNIMA